MRLTQAHNWGTPSHIVPIPVPQRRTVRAPATVVSRGRSVHQDATDALPKLSQNSPTEKRPNMHAQTGMHVTRYQLGGESVKGRRRYIRRSTVTVEYDTVQL